MYHLERIDLYLPIVAPNQEGYSIRKWKNVFGINPGVSNRIKSVTCLPKIDNTFIPSSIESKGCSKKNTKFLIYGEWKDTIDLYSEFDNEKFDLIILETVLYTSGLFDNKELLIKIKNHLSERGLFIIHLIADNIYSKNDAYKKLISAFKNVKIPNDNKLYELNNVLICSDN